jgi:thioester reductase-like protein
MNHTSDGTTNLSPEEKRALLVKLLQKKDGARESYPMSAREQLGFLNQLAINVTDLNDHAVLDPTICPEAVSVEPVTEPTHIFLTGATGFLGAFLLHELLHQTRADIYCLVRCSNTEEGKKRIQRNLESYLLGNECRSPRIIPVVGDLSEPLLGLSAQQFQMLARKIDVIYHNGALIKWFYSYNRLKSTNVLGTQEILRLASQIKVKSVHFISTLAVFPLIGNSKVNVIREQDTIDHGENLYGGYTQSKWVAEKLVTISRSRGLPICIYRPGLVTGHSQTGAWNTDDITCKMIKGWIELGYAPNLDAAIDMTPVDYVSSAIVYLSKLKQSFGKVFHMANPRPVHVNEFITWIHSFGYPLQRIPYNKWRTEMINLSRRSRETGLYSLVPLFSRLVGRMPKSDNTLDGLGSLFAMQYAARSIRFDCQNTLDGLASTPIVCPPVDAKSLDTYFSYFIRSGFLDAPDW